MLQNFPFLLMTALATSAPSVVAHGADWHKQLERELPVLGHRNWIVVADSAYPSQTSPGIKTIYAGGSQIDAVKHVMHAIDRAKHVRPVVYLDKELDFVPEEYASGIGAYRDELREALGQHQAKLVPHEEVINRLDEAGKTFHVVVIKTDLTLPYTSVFIRLDADYWSDEAESKLREAMQARRNSQE